LKIKDFLLEVAQIRKTGVATEHSYRAALQKLLDSIAAGVRAVNEPKPVECGAPDFIVQRGDLVIGHIEAKDLPMDIHALKGNNKDQHKRYLAGFPNLIYTNCRDWDFYRDGARVAAVSIADLHAEKGIQPRRQEFDRLATLLREFAAQDPQAINSPRELAERMAGKAELIKNSLRYVLRQDKKQQTELSQQHKAFQANLIGDITADDFADIYAETIAYGMFAARLHDDGSHPFSRQRALTLLPKSNPFLRSLFGYVAGPDLDESIVWIVDDLAQVFQACDMAQIMADFGKFTGQRDPFLHFYETFLAAYNPKKRKARGVWYTPEPVVNFIVRAVDEVLQTEFGLRDGLADTSKVTIRCATDKTDSEERQVHRVQILDPATGTGTFLAEVIKQIAPKIKKLASSMWSEYIERHLIPRLHGFELLMASYAMCHTKLDMTLTEMGYKPTKQPPRLSVYLTDSLEESGALSTQAMPFAQWLSNEAKGANEIKSEMPIMCVIGNPPYLGEGGKSKGWLGNLMDDYKKEPGGIDKLQERNSKWLNNSYIKFIRLSSNFIENNGGGVLGFITDNSYLDGPTFRGMRWHLLHTFDKIWILDLHGNSNKKEASPGGIPDKNIFDIKQGVAIIIAVKKNGSNKELAEVIHADLWGDRAEKYKLLQEADLTNSIFNRLQSPAPQHPFILRDYTAQAVYEKGFSIRDFMPVKSGGIVTSRDAITVDQNREALWLRVKNFAVLGVEEAKQNYKIKDTQGWTVKKAQADLNSDLSENHIKPIIYRPFDTRWTYYTGKSRGFIESPRSNIMRHMLEGNNLGLIIPRIKEEQVGGIVANKICGHKTYDAYHINSLFPLYLYSAPSMQGIEKNRRVNFDETLYRKLQEQADHPDHGTPGPEQVFDYIYGVLHCPAYRATYAEFLKIDFPRIPWPASAAEFWAVSKQGTALRRLHLMEPDAIGETPYPLAGEGDQKIEKPRFINDRIYINKTQYFDKVPETAWQFYIGGYQPAQKWLKDRKGR